MHDSAATPHDPRLGTIFEGRYRIESLIGKGGFGAVYRATQLGIERAVALKVLIAELMKDPREVARFEQEARIIAGLDHPHIVKLIELGQTADGSLFLAMEHLDGEPFARYLRREGPLAEADARRFGRQILEALAEAHAAGVVHRDLKPENLFVVTHPRRGATLKLLDFGIAKVAGERAPGMALTRTGIIVGSPRVMAPEQIVGDPITPRTDVYAFGCVAYEMLTGRPPFVRPTAAAYARAHLNEVVPWPSRGGEPVRGPLADLVMRCLTKDPQKRPASADEVLALWDATDDGPRAIETVTPRGLPRVTRALSEAALSTEPVAAPEVPPRRRRSRGVLVGALAFAGLGGALGAVALGSPGAGTTAADARPAAAPPLVRVASPVAAATAPTPPPSGSVKPAGDARSKPVVVDTPSPQDPPCSTRVRDGACLPQGFRTPGGLAWVGTAPERWLTRTEVTAAQYAACVGAGQCAAEGVGRAQATATRDAPDAGCNYGAPGRGDHPMNCVTRAEAMAFCAWQGGTLPTVDDWEAETADGAAARVHPWGEAEPSCAVVVMGDSPGGGCGRGGTWPVCEKAGDRSASGLCDMGGNVTEWLADMPRDMVGKLGGGEAALAGGAWHYDQPLAFENGVYAAEGEALRYTTVGFRCARSTRF